MPNLIQNYVNNIGQGISSVNNTTKKYYNNLTDSNSDNLLAPLDGKGYLVENSLVTYPKELAKDTYYTAKSLQRGITGKANDHELGKLNDLGLKLGGLSIATYLMTKRQTPKQKAMEFIGFGAFLASMAVWPKVALQWPAQLVHGFNFRKQYVDEQGRKKYVTQDPNYIPIDLYKGKRKSEDLGHIADRMGIDKNEKDRNELAKEHIRKVSVQNNTLWMLTAGVATPVMTALACNRLEKPVGKFFEKITNNKVNKLIDKIEEYNQSGDKKLEDELITSKMDNESGKKLDALLNMKKGKPINDKDVDAISEALTVGLDNQTRQAARLDLGYMLSSNQTVVNEKTVNSITDSITKKLDTKYGEGYTSQVLDAKKLAEHVDNFMGQNGRPANGILSAEQSDNLRKSLNDFFGETLKNNTTMREARKEVIADMFFDSVNEVFEKNKATVLTDEAAGYISKAGQTIRKYRAFDETISSASHFKVEKASETLAGNNWGEVTETLIKELNISPKELNEAKSSEELTAQLFTRKLEDIAKDEKRYKKFITNISNKMTELDVKLDNPRAGKRPAMDTIIDSIARNHDKTAAELNGITKTDSKPFFNLAQRIAGENIDGVFVGTVKDAKIQRIKTGRIGSIQNAYMRLLHTADFFRRAEEYNKTNIGFSGNPKLDKSLIEKAKKVLMSSHSGDFYLKFETNNNVNFYKALMWHTFLSGDISNATKDAFKYVDDAGKVQERTCHEVFRGKTTIPQRITRWAQSVGKLMGITENAFLKNHMIDHASSIENEFKPIEKTAFEKFNKIACTPDNMLYNALKQKFNSNKWLRMWTTVGSIVLGVTLASQFAFGKQDKTTQTNKQVNNG